MESLSCNAQVSEGVMLGLYDLKKGFDDQVRESAATKTIKIMLQLFRKVKLIGGCYCEIHCHTILIQ